MVISDICIIFGFAMRFCAEIIYIIAITLLSLWFASNHEHNPNTCKPSAPTEIGEEIITTDTIRLLFGGDLMQHLPQVVAARTYDGEYDYTTSFEHIAPMFRDADIAILNLETTITLSGRYSGYPCFASPPAIADALVDMGVDIALLANNHCCDRYRRGIETTINELTKRNIAHVGVYRDSVDYRTNNIRYFECKGVDFALVNYTYGTNGMPIPKGKVVNLIDSVAIKRDLRSIPRDSVDCIIACMHWGIEYERKANAEQRRLSEMLRREGVDIIIGSHPHVVQPFEADSTHVVFYSLGNLVSNQRKRYTDGGLLAEVEIIRSDTARCLRYSAEAHPVWVLCPEYRVLPRHIGDTLPMPNEARQQYTQFMSDTQRLLGIE